MTVAELIELAKNRKVTQEDINRFRQLAIDNEKQFEEKAKRTEVTQEVLRRTYTL